MTHRDREYGPSGRGNAVADADHRPDGLMPSDGPYSRPERAPCKAFGQRRARINLLGITSTHAPGRTPWNAVSMGYCQ